MPDEIKVIEPDAEIARLVGRDWIRHGPYLYKVEGADAQTTTVILHTAKVVEGNLQPVKQTFVLSRGLVEAIAHHYGEAKQSVCPRCGFLDR